MKLKLVSNWKQAYKSLAVWFPVVAATGLTFAEEALNAHLVPDTLIPVVILVTGLLGRVIKQKSMSGD